jgi:hypothetical protein
MPTTPLAFDASLAATLACPACHGELRPEETRLVCASCARGYPVVDGIPVLIAERAESAGEASLRG